MNDKKPLPAHIARELSVEASCDPRTIQRVWMGVLPVRGLSKERAEEVLRKHGYLSTVVEGQVVPHLILGGEEGRLRPFF